ncbi:DNA repair protein RAD4-like [Hibiscus syriacus]|uniref:DNA repair protein RAD4-like n=1 Tax=Hibiscus syriacus TaxID=106335 RepID=UPI0019206B95|nr:DNA repair protein RAD4-like [Hibiscus syriacus]
MFVRLEFEGGLKLKIARGMLVYVNAWHISTRSTTVHDGCAAEDWFTAADQLKQLPRVFAVAKRLEIDYAPAMVGFEFRNGHATFVFDGFVVCKEFKDAILEYAEEEERRAAEEKKRNEAQAISRCYQLLSSIITRQKLNSYYGNSSSSQSSFRDVQDTNNEIKAPVESSQDGRQSTGHLKGDNIGTMYTASSGAVEVRHEHVYLTKNESFDAENSARTKRCECGFSIQVEEIYHVRWSIQQWKKCRTPILHISGPRLLLGSCLF